jgi:peroxiredoxin
LPARTDFQTLPRMALLRFLLVFALLPVAVRGGETEADWQAIVALDAGPRTQPRTPEEWPSMIAAHIAAQERALRAFIAEHASSRHAFEARLRLARLLAMRGEYEGSAAAQAESRRLFAELEKAATPEQRTELDFARISALMRRAGTPTPEQRNELLSAARKFQRDHPADRRVAPLLAEIASLFDAQPKTKRALLQDAQVLALDDETRARVADDLTRLDLIGTAISLRGATTDGRPVDVAEHRGKVVIVAFFAAWSPPARKALASLQRAASAWPKDRVQVLGVSLDNSPEELAALLREQKVTWPVAFDGKGWESPLVRALGINTLPAVWLLDRQGRLRSLTGLQNTEAQVRQLVSERG